MDANTGEIKFMKDLKPEDLNRFKPLPQEGEIIRFEGTEFCFKIKSVSLHKVILKPVPASEYKPPTKFFTGIKPNPDDGHFDA